MSLARNNEFATFSLVPKSFEEASKFAELISKSSFCPKDFKGNPGDVLIAIQMGSEIGLAPMQALQNIAVINGRPSVWGDAAIALARSHSHCQEIEEWIDGDIESGNAVAYCRVTRKGGKSQTRSFSIADAKKANLWDKPGPWKQYPKRMLQMRARGFALRDVFPDALKGLNIAEEVIDLPRDDYHVTPNENTKQNNLADRIMKNLSASRNEDEHIVEPTTGEIIDYKPVEQTNKATKKITLEKVKDMIGKSLNKDALALAADLARELEEVEKEEVRSLYKDKLQELESKGN